MNNPYYLRDYPIFRTTAEIENFFQRIEPFTDARKLEISLVAAQPSERLGQFSQLTENAGKSDAVLEILADVLHGRSGVEVASPHLVLFPCGWAALLRHLDDGSQNDTAHIDILVLADDTGDGDQTCAALAQVLLGLQDAVGATPRKNVPIGSRRQAPWPDILAHCFQRDQLDVTYGDLVSRRGSNKAEAARSSRSDLINQYLRWYTENQPVRRPVSHSSRTVRSSIRSHTAPVDMKHHVINMRFGELSKNGQFQTSPSDVATIADRAKDWIDAGNNRRLMIYAHGGLVSEASALDYARATAPWWIENNVYPVFCVWESDVISTILQLIRQTMPGGRRGERSFSDITDHFIEGVAHAFGTSIWAGMKRNARQCSAPGNQHGLTLFLQELKRAFGGNLPEPDLVGHSAGSILHLHLLQRMEAEGIRARSFQTLAPAATTTLYREVLKGISSGLPCRIYTMTDQAERSDNVIQLYRKSLLYLVSKGFETEFGQPIAGLQKHLRGDASLLSLLSRWSGGVAREALVFSPTPPGTPKRLRSSATSHGGFDNDGDTMWSVMRFIHGPGDDALISPFPAHAARTSDPDAGALPEELIRYLALLEQLAAAPPQPPSQVQLQSPATGTAPQHPPVTARQPARLALTIGIDGYGGGNQLHGCVRDSDTWRDLLTERGFSVTQHIRPEETSRDHLIRHLGDFVGRAMADDVLVWHFSGHGMELSGDDEDFEKSAIDQAIVGATPDDQPGTLARHALIDDEIHRILHNLHPQASLYVFLDSCFSGSATRLALPGRSRSLGRVTIKNHIARMRPLVLPASGARGGYNAYASVNHVLFSAASAFQTALENGNPPEGVFTRNVRKLLNSRPGPMSNAQFRDHMVGAVAEVGQTPGLYCDTSRRDLPFPLI